MDAMSLCKRHPVHRQKSMAQPKKEKGFTLVEVMAAIFIFMFGILAVGAMQSAAIRGNSFAYRVTKGTTLAMDTIEDLVGLTYDAGDLESGSHAPVSYGGYTVSWEVETDEPVPNAKRITVSVSWEDRGQTKLSQVTYVKPMCQDGV